MSNISIQTMHKPRTRYMSFLLHFYIFCVTFSLVLRRDKRPETNYQGEMRKPISLQT
jgi:hypothetical protein